MNGSDDTRDRRRHPRTGLILKVDYPSADRFLRDYTLNISKGGTMLRTRRAVEVGDDVDLVLSFPGLLAPIGLRGEVRWAEEETNETQIVGILFRFQSVNRISLKSHPGNPPGQIVPPAIPVSQGKRKR